MEVPPMTRTEAIKEFFRKAVLPVAIAGLLYCIFKSACIRNGEMDLLWLWILCGLPFGIHRMCVWIVPGGDSLGGGAALFVLNFVIGGYGITRFDPRDHSIRHFTVKDQLQSNSAEEMDDDSARR